MTPEDFATALTNRLRRRGLHVLPEDVRSFTPDIGQRMTDTPDMEAMEGWFIKARDTANTLGCSRIRFLLAFASWLVGQMTLWLLANLVGLLPMPLPGFASQPLPAPKPKQFLCMPNERKLFVLGGFFFDLIRSPFSPPRGVEA
jgi:hypothetical protein